MLLDEPLEGLDERTYLQLLDDLPRVLAEFSSTTVLVTHSRHEALRLAQDLVVLVDGRVHAAGSKHEVVTSPPDAAAAEVLGYSVLAVANAGSVSGEMRRVAVAPGALVPGPGPLEFAMTVEGIADLVEYQEIIGFVGDVHVRVALPPGHPRPSRGERLQIHAERFCELARA